MPMDVIFEVRYKLGPSLQHPIRNLDIWTPGSFGPSAARSDYKDIASYPHEQIFLASMEACPTSLPSNA